MIGVLRRDFVAERGEHALTLVARFFDHAGGEIGAAAAQRAVRLGVPGRRLRDADLIARMFEHGGGGFGDLGIEMVAEGVDEQDHLAARARRRPTVKPANAFWRRHGNGTPGGDAQAISRRIARPVSSGCAGRMAKRSSER